MILFLANEIQEMLEDDASVMSVKGLGLRRDYSALSRRITLCLNTRPLPLQYCKTFGSYVVFLMSLDPLNSRPV